MSKWSGCVLILAGVAVGTYALYPQPSAGPEAASAQIAGEVTPDKGLPSPASVTRSSSGPDAALPKPAPNAELRPTTQRTAASGSAPPAEPVRDNSPATSVAPQAHLVPPAAVPAPVPAKRPRSATTTVQVDETIARVPVGDTKTATAPLDKAALTREIQRQLKRVGCYKGDVSGVWTSSVRQAMQALNDRANASLPIDGPDPVLLAMVQSQAPGTCSAACPSGQDRIADGRCVPTALVASVAAGKAGKHQLNTRTATASAGATAPPEGRMALAGPPATTPSQQAKATAQSPQAVPRRTPRVAGWSRTAPQVRTRRAYRQPNSNTYSGMPSWFPFFQ